MDAPSYSIGCTCRINRGIIQNKSVRYNLAIFISGVTEVRKLSLHPPGDLNCTIYHIKYSCNFVMFCFIVLTSSSHSVLHSVFIHILQGCVTGTGAIVQLPQCLQNNSEGYGLSWWFVLMCLYYHVLVFCMAFWYICFAVSLLALANEGTLKNMVNLICFEPSHNKAKYIHNPMHYSWGVFHLCMLILWNQAGRWWYQTLNNLMHNSNHDNKENIFEMLV